MKQNKEYKFRIYPNTTQKILLAKSFGCCRFVWNYLVEKFNKMDNNIISTTDMRKENEWMKEVSAGVLQQKFNDFREFKNQFFIFTKKYCCFFFWFYFNKIFSVYNYSGIVNSF